MNITAAQKKRFRTIGHNLKPVVIISSNGLSTGVLEETSRALNDHELIKVKFAVGDRDEKKALINELCKETGATLVQTIGNIALVFKPAKEPNPSLSNLLRG